MSLQGSEANAPPTLCTERQDHPAWTLLQEQAQHLPVFVTSLQNLTTNEFHQPIGRGWEYLAVITPPPLQEGEACSDSGCGSHHHDSHQHTARQHSDNDGQHATHADDDGSDDGELLALTSQSNDLDVPEPRLEGPYKLRLSIPADYPASPPRFRFASIIDHINITDMGYLVPVNYWKLVLDWNPQRTLTDVLRMCSQLLVDPYYPVLTNYNDIVDDWEYHSSNHCPCVASECFTMPYADFAKLSPSEKLTAVQAFKLRLHDAYSEQQERAVRRSLNRQQVAREWLRKTGFPELYDAAAGWQSQWFVPSFLEAIRDGSEEAIRRIVTMEAPGIYSFDMFTPQFCRNFMRDLRLYENSEMPKYRPNSMNNYGLVVNDMGMEQMIDRLIAEYLQPFVQHLFSEATAGQPVDQHHSFVVEYRQGQDVSLDMHTDDSDVTFNVNICDDFTGAGLSFCGLYGAIDRRRLNYQYEHKLGRVVVHAGLHTHGADSLVTGERLNLIIWCRSSRFRQSLQFQERFMNPTLTEEEPDLRCLSRTHDRDYQYWVAELSHPQHRESDMS